MKQDKEFIIDELFFIECDKNNINISKIKEVE